MERDEKERARRDAVANEQQARSATDAANSAKESEADQRQQAQAIAGIFDSFFIGLDPKEAAPDLNGYLSRRVDETAAKAQAIRESLVRARLQYLMGRAQLTLFQPDKAETLVHQALDTYRQCLGYDHAITLDCMMFLAFAYYNGSKIERAAALFEEAVRGAQRTHGEDHHRTLYLMEELADKWMVMAKLDDKGKYAKALALYEEWHEKGKAKYGPDNIHTYYSFEKLIDRYGWAGLQSKSLTLTEAEHKRRIAKFGPDHPDTLRSMNILGKAYCDANQGEKGAATLKEFVAGQRKRAKPDDPPFAGLLAQVALDLLKCRQHAAAEELLRECLAIREKKEPDAWTTFNTKSLLGGALLGQKKYADHGAPGLLLAGYEGMKQREKTIPPQANTRIPEAIDRLIELYTATDKPEEVKKWRAERAKYPAAALPQEKM